uniref:RNA-directed DNA polymerase n=1 Tax=Steinernema glaseri TaxID=37863 RepID=A0A1I7YER0_9BILA
MLRRKINGTFDSIVAQRRSFGWIMISHHERQRQLRKDRDPDRSPRNPSATFAGLRKTSVRRIRGQLAELGGSGAQRTRSGAARRGIEREPDLRTIWKGEGT